MGVVIRSRGSARSNGEGAKCYTWMLSDRYQRNTVLYCMYGTVRDRDMQIKGRCYDLCAADDG